jgi:hypothetical protein
MPNDAWREFYARVNQAALARYPAILADWLPGGRVQSGEYCTAGLSGGAGQSLRVHIADDPKKGVWAEFNGGTASGRNAIDLYAKIRDLSYREAAAELAERFRIEKPAPRLKLAEAGRWQAIVPAPDYATFTEAGLPDIPARADGGTAVAWWAYLDADARLIQFRVRIEGGGRAEKEILPVSWCRNADTGEERWMWRDVPAPRPLYGLEILGGAEPDAPILIVQGEKTADAARRMLADRHGEWVVVTNPGGDNRANTKHTDWSPVINHAGPVTIWPDNDQWGVKAAAIVALALQRPVRVVRPDPRWKQGWDLADAEAEGWNGDQVLAYIAAHSVMSEPPARERVVCDISGSDLEERSVAVWNAVKAVNDPPTLFRSGNGLVIARPELQVLALADGASLRHWLTTRVKFQRTWRDNVVPTVPGRDLLENLLVYANPPIPFLRRKALMPIQSEQGEVIVTPGFHPASGVYYLAPPDLELLELKAEPTPDEIQHAVELIDDLVCDFPFADDSARAHMFAFVLTIIVRDTIAGPTPLFVFEAPAPGTGKSLLMEVLSYLLLRDGCLHLPPTADDEEFSKKLTSAFMSGETLITWDNVEDLRVPALKRALTGTIWTDRVLGVTEHRTWPIRAVFAATTNNPTWDAEMLRRTVSIRLDAGVERPHLRSGFRHHPIQEYVQAARSDLVRAFLTLAQAAGMEQDADAPVLGGFEAWSRRISAILKRAGVTGFLANREAVELEQVDTEHSAWLSFVERWRRQFADQWVTLRDLLPLAQDVEGFYLGRSDKERAQLTSLGMGLRKRRGAIIRGYRIAIREFKSHQYGAQFSLQATGASRNEGEADEDIPF